MKIIITFTFIIVVLCFHVTGEQAEETANAFVTFHLTNSAQIIYNIDQIQREFLQKDWRFLHTFQPLNSLHVSLLFVHLDELNFKNATEGLLAAIEKFHGIFGKNLRVHFKSISHNGNASVYAALNPIGQNIQRMTKLHEFLAIEFTKRGIPSLNPFHENFHPHATILALTQPSDIKLIKYWPEEERKWYGKVLGTEKIKAIQICNMTMDERTKDYDILFEAKI